MPGGNAGGTAVSTSGSVSGVVVILGTCRCPGARRAAF